MVSMHPSENVVTWQASLSVTLPRSRLCQAVEFEMARNCSGEMATRLWRSQSNRTPPTSKTRALRSETILEVFVAVSTGNGKMCDFCTRSERAIYSRCADSNHFMSRGDTLTVNISISWCLFQPWLPVSWLSTASLSPFLYANSKASY